MPEKWTIWGFSVGKGVIYIYMPGKGGLSGDGLVYIRMVSWVVGIAISLSWLMKVYSIYFA